MTGVYLSNGIKANYKLSENQPKVSIVVPVRNEEENLHIFLSSLLQIDYPYDLLQIILVNDQSEDSTREIALDYRNKFLCDYKVIDLNPNTDKELTGKVRPLSQGIDQASGEIILMTDADCLVPPSWVKSMVAHFEGNVGVVCGPTLPQNISQPKLFNRLEALDWSFLMGGCAAISGLGSAEGLIGSNFSIARKAYDEIGTYRVLSQSFIDDLSLMQAVKKTGNWRAIFPGHPNTVVYTKPLNKLSEIITQRHRWMQGAGMIESRGRFYLFFTFAMHLSWPFWIYFVGLKFLIPYTLLFLADGLIIAPMLSMYGNKSNLKFLPIYPLFRVLYEFPLSIALITKKKVKWKKREVA